MEQEIKDLFKAYKADKDVKARDKIVEKYLYIAQILAKKFVGRGIDYDDLYQVASLALLKGIDRFDPSLGVEFTTFITPTITGEIKNYFRDRSRIVKVPRRLAKLNAEIKDAKDELFLKTGKKPTAKELADYLGVTEEEILSASEIGGTVSLDAGVASEGDEEGSRYDYIADDKDFFEAFENRESIKSALKELNDTERKVVSLRFGEELSQSETAKRLGVSQMFISRMERKILAKLRELLKDCV